MGYVTSPRHCAWQHAAVLTWGLISGSYLLYLPRTSDALIRHRNTARSTIVLSQLHSICFSAFGAVTTPGFLDVERALPQKIKH
jgi:hypothetical protein